MSPSSIRRLTRMVRHLCTSCGVHRARYQYRGFVRADRDHTMCFRCFRTERERQRARLLVTGARSLSPRQHRATGPHDERPHENERAAHPRT